MIATTWGESMSENSAHPKGNMENDKGIYCNDEWGDKNCNEHSLCVGFINIQTFPTSIKHHKNSNMIQLIHDYHLSVLGLAETNLYWPSIPHDQQIAERTRQWFEHTVSYSACNTCNTKMTNQRGGSAIIA